MLVRLQSGGVAVFSPTSITPEIKQTVASLGELKYIVAPDFEVRKISFRLNDSSKNLNLLASH